MVCNRPETDDPKRLAAVELDVVNTNWRPDSGFDSALESENTPLKPVCPGIRYAAPAPDLKPGAPIRISLGWPELMMPTGASEEPAASPPLEPMSVTDCSVVGILPKGIVPVRKAAEVLAAP